MTEAAQSGDVKHVGRKRKSGKKKGTMAKKRQRTMHQGGERKVKITPKTRKLYQKRARDYNSDNSDDEVEDEEAASAVAIDEKKQIGDGFDDGVSDDGEEENEGEGDEEVSEDESGKIQPGIVRFSEGIKAFKAAFKSVVKKIGADEDVLGPVLSANKKLLAEKLAEEEVEKKVKGEVKKEKHMISEKGHAKPAEFLDAHEKFLLGVATKGVVKLFNAVNKSQNAQRGLNPLRTKDEKVIKQRRKEAFFSELGTQKAATVIKVGASGGSADVEAPGWAPLHDNYMLTNPKLKDWDKMQDTNDADDFGRASDANSSSDDE